MLYQENNIHQLNLSTVKPVLSFNVILHHICCKLQFTTEPTHGSNEWMEEKDADVSDSKEKQKNTDPLKYNKRDTGLKGGIILIS